MSDRADSPPIQHRVRILAVGSNAVSAFYSWRLASSKACEVTVVWRRNWQAVQDYGIAFQSEFFGSERWKPAHVVQQVEDAVEVGRPYDYILVCVKVIPELYELADVIADVVTPSHTCILLNTTTTIGVEKSLGTRFPKNLIVSLVNFAELNQTGGFEFEHLGDSAKVWIGTALRNDTIPEETQQDMAESLALTLEAGSVDCHVSPNILQQQWEKMIGPIAFHCMSVIAQEPNFKSLIADTYSNRIIRGILSECMDIATRQNCIFPKHYINEIIQSMTCSFPSPDDTEPLDPTLLTTMYQDLLANRPLEFEVYLGNPVRMADDLGIHVPNLQALYAIARHINKARTKPDVARSPLLNQPRQLAPPRQSIQSVNGRGRGMPPRSFSDGSPNGTGARGKPMNGYRPQGQQRRGSFEGDFDQFKDIAMYGEQIGEDIPPATNGDVDYPPQPRSRPSPNGIEDAYHPRSRVNGDQDYNAPRSRGPPQPRMNPDFELRNRELMLRERELQLREREMEIQRRQGAGRVRHNVPSTIMDDEDDEDDTRPSNSASQRQLMMGGDNFDMMSVTGRRARNKPNPTSSRGKAYPEHGGSRLMSLGGRSKGRSSSIISSQATFDPLNENPLMGFTSNRYPGVDTRTLAASSRANSLTSQRMDEMGMNPGRTASMLGGAGPGTYPPMGRGPPGRGGPMMGPGPSNRGRPPPPPQHQSDYPPPVGTRGYHDPSPVVLAPGLSAKDPKVRSTTGSASASSASLGGNGESHSSSSSLEPPIHHTRI